MRARSIPSRTKSSVSFPATPLRRKRRSPLLHAYSGGAIANPHQGNRSRALWSSISPTAQ